MNNLKNKFGDTFKNSAFTELLQVGVDIKRADKSTTTRANAITLISCIGMTVLGYFALEVLGAVIFLIISYTASFYLNYSLKKKVLLAYLKFYREKLPPTLYEGIKKIDKPSISSTLCDFYPDTLHHWTVCYSFDGVEAGFSRIMSGNRETVSGMAVIVPGAFSEGTVFKGWFPALSDEYADDLTTLRDGDKLLEFAKILEGEFENFAIKCSSEYALMYIPSAQDFMTSRVEDKDGLSPAALARQFGYYNLALALKTLDVEGAKEALSLFGADYAEEDAVYQKLWEKKKK